MATKLDPIEQKSPPVNRRAGERHARSFPVVIATFNREGDFVIERTTTHDVSKHGCRLTTNLPVVEGDIVSVAMVNPRNPAEQGQTGWFQVAWVNRIQDQYTIGIQQISGKFLWDV
jgi:PilZ domain